jgi:hypothetical protein
MPERLYTQPSIDKVIKPAPPAHAIRAAKFVPRYGSPDRSPSPSRRACSPSSHAYLGNSECPLFLAYGS